MPVVTNRRAVWGTSPKHMERTQLTPRETEILEMMIEETPSNKDIAVRYGISEETVKRHLSSIMDKTGYSTRMELVVRTLQKRIESGAVICARLVELENDNARLRVALHLEKRKTMHLGAVQHPAA
jgi:DNA-binding CsgD family transcriptional regulator